MQKIEFYNYPKKLLNIRRNPITFLKDNDKKFASLKVANVNSQSCKLVVKLLLKEPDNQNHFYEICRSIDKIPQSTIEQEINSAQSIVELDFFGIKKRLKKDALQFLKEQVNGDAKVIYDRNLYTIVLQICLIDVNTGELYDTLKFELNTSCNDIIVIDYSPRTLLNGDNKLDITFLLKKPEKDAESISLELKIGRALKIFPKKLKTPLSLKNVFVFSLKHITIDFKNFEARLCRNGSNTACSEWMTFIIQGNENMKRKANSDHEYCLQNKIPRLVSSGISENMLSEVSFDLSNSSSSVSCFNDNVSNRQILNKVLEIRILSNIARVGHDFAFGSEVTDFMQTISNTLPVVYIIQDDVGDTPLHNAILKDQEDRAIEILNIVNRHFPNDLYTRNTSNHTALILAPACNVSSNFVQRLIFHGFDLRDKDIEGNNALSIAIEYKNTEVLRTLVKNASAKKIFHDDISEIISLIKKTIIEKYMEGYKILMDFCLVSGFSKLCLDPSNLHLDSNSIETFNQYSKEIDVSPVSEESIEEYLDYTDTNIGIDEFLSGD